MTCSRSYELPACKHYVKTLLSHYINFKFVVFLDEDERFIAYTTSKAILQLLESERGSGFVEAISNNKKTELLKCPGVVKERVLITETNLNALRKMVQKNLEAIVVIEDDGMVAGLVERGHLTSKLLLELAG
jgi:CBS-domain-containing membrane protein